MEPAEFTELADNLLMTGEIEGWRHREDLCLLYWLARDLEAPGITLEIGSYKGLATTALAFGVRFGKRAPLHTVDPHTGDRQELESGRSEESSWPDFQNNLKRAGIAEEVVAYKMTSNELAARWRKDRIRFLFIDGWHSYEAVADDISNWVPFLDEGGAVIIDDYLNYHDVRSAVDDARELLPKRQRNVGRMWLAHSGALPPKLESFLSIPWG